MEALAIRWDAFMTPQRAALLHDVGLLVLRVGVGLMMAFSHGLGKMQKLMAGGEIQFGDPIGIGVVPSLFLAGTAEFFASLAVAVGLFTRLAAIPLAITMSVAAFIVHAQDPFAKQEFALLYLFAFVCLIVAGPGRFSLDAVMRKRFARS